MSKVLSRMTGVERQEKVRIERGFQLEGGAVVVSRRLKDGWWESWIEKAETTQEPFDSPIFLGATRFKAQCKASHWYKSTLKVCA